MKYNHPVYRPPSEAFGLILQATYGCSHNKCRFCTMYKSKEFKIRNLNSILDDIKNYNDYGNPVEKVFIGDGDALILNFSDLKEIIITIKQLFPKCSKISLYGSPKSILNKSLDELKQLKKLGLSMVYLGIESGSNKVLKLINKGVNQEEMILAGLKIKEAGISLSATLITGLGGYDNLHEHAIESAKIINAIQPNDLALLKLMIIPQSPLFEDVQNGTFKELSLYESLQEIQLLIKNLIPNNFFFRCNKLSNCINLSGNFKESQKLFLNKLDELLLNQDYKNPTWENPKIPIGLGS